MFRKYVLPIARVLAIWLGVAGALFGQLFFGDFSVGATLSGVGAAIAGALSWGSRRTPKLLLIVGISCVAALVGVAMETITYYRELDIPGNDFAWELRGPFVGALLLIGYDTFASFRNALAARE
jgi:hypothetical protein